MDPFTDRTVCRETKNKPDESSQRPAVDKQTNLLALLATLARLILVTRHTMQAVNGSMALWKSLVRNSETNRARDKSIASEQSVGGIANQVNGRGTATSLL